MFLELLTMCRTLMASGGGCFALAVQLAIVDGHPAWCTPHSIDSLPSQLDSQAHSPPPPSEASEMVLEPCQGCVAILSSFQEGKLSSICTVWQEEAERVLVFLCKDRSDCFPETRLVQLRPKHYLETDGVHR
ncbi:LOW QUALITY PROTEIN: CD160 antigen [Molossus nigricans]